ncbi:hypothetical protein C487_10942 [Natrinema pallidum DSM 3751]|uniref:Uncharacterized protein n=1 Tax=Natrinema pallidum DSM 3751 TaxID=1227495 RepID=L9YQV5_9EURY|nr:hypothetical protein C487_10942 [Natrinema pallidum DSM 3751]
MVDVVQRDRLRIGLRGDDIDLAEFVEPVPNGLFADGRTDARAKLLDRKKRAVGFDHDLDDVSLREFLVERRIEPFVDPRWERRHR